MFEQTVAADEVVIEQGADGDFFYVVDKGVYHALIKTWYLVRWAQLCWAQGKIYT